MANFTSIRQETSTRKQERNTWQLSDRLTWALGLSVKPSTKLVAVAIAHHAGKTSGLAWPSLATIAATTGLSRRQVVYAIHALEAGEHLAVSRLKVGKKNAANRYRLPRMGGAQVTLPLVQRFHYLVQRLHYPLVHRLHPNRYVLLNQ